MLLERAHHPAGRVPGRRGESAGASLQHDARALHHEWGGDEGVGDYSGDAEDQVRRGREGEID